MSKENTNPKAILFDLDGVLVDMPDGHYESLNNALRLFGVEIDRDEHMSYFNGLPTKKKLERLEQEGRLPLGLRDFINDHKQHHTKEVIPRYCVPDYSKIIMLKQLKSRGYKLACCSNSIEETLHMMLKSAQLFDFFDVIIGNTQVKNSKPHPEMYLTAFDMLDVKPHEAIIIEDSPHGIEAAKASGATVYEVRGVRDVHLSLFEHLI
jgi:HAD superfamily hydrolase (TIGR01509 family)